MRQLLLGALIFVVFSCSGGDDESNENSIETGAVPTRVVIGEPADGHHTAMISRDGGPFLSSTSANDDPNDLDVQNGDVIKITSTHIYPYKFYIRAEYENGAEENFEHNVSNGSIVMFYVQAHE